MERKTIKLNILARKSEEVEVETPAFFRLSGGRTVSMVYVNNSGDITANEITLFPKGDYAYFQGVVLDRFRLESAVPITREEFTDEFEKMAKSIANDLDQLIEMATVKEPVSVPA